MASSPKIVLFGLDEVERSVLSCVQSARLVASVLCYDEQEPCCDYILSQVRPSGYSEVRCVVVIHSGRSNASKAPTLSMLDTLSRRFARVPVLLLDLTATLPDAIATRRFAGIPQPADVLDAVRTLWRSVQQDSKRASAKNSADNPGARMAASVSRLDRMMQLAEGTRA